MPILFEPIDEDEAAAEATRIKTMAEQQSNALRLAADAEHLAGWMERRSLNGAKELRTYAAELRRLAAVEEERDKLRELAACAYAGLGAECELPEVWLDALNNAVRGAMPGVRMSKTVGMEDKGDWIELRIRLEPDELGPRADDQEAPASLEGLEVSDSNFGEFLDSGGKLL